ncbi:MAG: YjjG family noncanonical pyrimidine nucleotidase [Bacteroidota bacterium]
MQKKYTHLFFDLDNTLWDFEKNSYDALETVFNHFQISCEKDIDFKLFFKVYSFHNHQCWQEYRQGKLSKQELVGLRFKKTFEHFNISGIDTLQMNNLYLENMPMQKRLVEGAHELLSYLKKKGYLLFIITNGFTEVQHKKLETTGLRQYFTKIFTSEEIKAPKPSRVIFEHAVRSANAKKSSCLMIGDDAEVDILGALSFGMDAVYLGKEQTINFKPTGKKIIPKFYLIRNLSELQFFL